MFFRLDCSKSNIVSTLNSLLLLLLFDIGGNYLRLFLLGLRISFSYYLVYSIFCIFLYLTYFSTHLFFFHLSSLVNKFFFEIINWYKRAIGSIGLFSFTINRSRRFLLRLLLNIKESRSVFLDDFFLCF